ncbi:STAS domain-containing protein, partial [Acetobacter orientalis]|uniref:STAS domain-containing protein n=1 Tax=Acetobacter orientalis TaxID=146474 RepID=UPI0039EB0EB8
MPEQTGQAEYAAVVLPHVMTQKQPPAPDGPASGTPAHAAWSLETQTGTPVLRLSGSWDVAHGGMAPFPADGLQDAPHGQTLQIDTSQITNWDSAFVAFLWDVKQAAGHAGVEFDPTSLPDGAQRLLALLPRAPAPPPAPPTKTNAPLPPGGAAPPPPGNDPRP